ncbi:hypothetical protein BKI52_00740 [marine bacterium AO1-C]|nr:hypothetical protein BKI52_00740 [marine bacterium AO1-C]
MKKFYNLTFMVLVCWLLSPHVFGQERTITGKVTDKSGAGIPGATVIIKGTTNGTATDAEGQFKLFNVPEKAILVFSTIGMQTKEVKVGNKSHITVTLEEAPALEEVVVTSYSVSTGSRRSTGSTKGVSSAPKRGEKTVKTSDDAPKRGGLITAGEWNDLDHWQYWKKLTKRTGVSKMCRYWKYYPKRRVAIQLQNTSKRPLVDVPVAIKLGNSVVWETKTDNFGRAELWIAPNKRRHLRAVSNYTLWINNRKHSSVSRFKKEIKIITLEGSSLKTPTQLDIAFVVDATGSMGDELSYLKKELNDVIDKAATAHPKATIRTSAVFYRDQGDEYVSRVSSFDNETATTINFIQKQMANGGGDYPEAVDEALDKAINTLEWSQSAKNRLLFLLLDAPPHYKKKQVKKLHRLVEKAASKGIKIIPITASGIDKNTEFLMRFMAIVTNGTYVFITDDSGIGNKHLKPTVGDFKVEYLNNLMIRLICKYLK